MHSITAPLAAALVLIGTVTAFAAGNAVGANDKRLFAKEDERRLALIARACGKSGRLLYDHHAEAYLCLWQHRDGASVTAEVPSYPYLDQIASN